jgi:hypothetical protein
MCMSVEGDGESFNFLVVMRVGVFSPDYVTPSLEVRVIYTQNYEVQGCVVRFYETKCSCQSSAKDYLRRFADSAAYLESMRLLYIHSKWLP